MSAVLVAVPAVPLVAALALTLFRSTAVVAARIAIIASAVAFAAGVVTLVAVGVDGPMSVVVTADDGDAMAGLAADRVGAILITLTTLVGLIVQSFASRSLRGDLRAGRFHVLALLLTASTTLVAISATGIGFVVGWIATSVVLVALIGHRSPWPPAVAAQRRTGWSFLIGDSVLVVALVVALVLVGDIDLRSVGADAAALDGQQFAGVNALTVVATLLVLAGTARSALVPIHRWLPSTLAAPTPVSALLHAGVINGAGVLLIRFSPVFASSATAMAVAFAIGTLTALLATAVMLVRTDVKGGLVWSTAGQMGFMVMQLGVGAFAAALFHIVGHAMYKAAMFLGAGGAISAHHRQQQRPHLGLAARTTLTSWPVRLLIGLVVPLASFALALAIVDPHLTASATILIVVFGVLSVGRAANGWMGSTPFRVITTILTADDRRRRRRVRLRRGHHRVRALRRRRRAVRRTGRSGPAVGGSHADRYRHRGRRHHAHARTSRPGSPSQGVRLARLDRRGNAPARRRSHRSRPPFAGVGELGPRRGRNARHRRRPLMTTVAPSTRSLTAVERSELLADVSQAGSFVAPYWPLTAFVAVNPLGGLQDRSFLDATDTARAWFSARTHLPLSAYREERSRGQISDADLDAAIVRLLPEVATAAPLTLGSARVEVLDVLRFDLVGGPTGAESGAREPRPPTRSTRSSRPGAPPSSTMPTFPGRCLIATSASTVRGAPSPAAIGDCGASSGGTGACESVTSPRTPPTCWPWRFPTLTSGFP